MKQILVLAVALLISGCISQVKTSVTAFHTDDIYVQGRTVKVVHADKDQSSSLSFQTYKKIFENEFTKYGYIPTDNDDADLFAIVNYGIDDGTTTTHVGSSNVYGQTGGGYTTHTGSLYSSGYSGNTYYSGSSYTAPTYGVIGTETYTYEQTKFKRFAAMEIYRTADIDEPNPTPLYEARAKSAGSCGNISLILPYIVQSMFENFPGEHGKSKTVLKEWDGKC